MNDSYGGSHIKRRRATQAQMEDREDALYTIVADGAPMTVRQVFYQATVHEIVEKTEAGYAKVQRTLAELRREGQLPWQWIADNTRWQRKPATYDNLADALEQTSRFYRRSLWKEAPAYVEVWLEKDALSGVIYPITSKYDVPLMVARGYASLSFLHSAADQIAHLGKPAYIYHLGDHDPSGVNAGEKIEETLRELAPDAEIYFERLAVLPGQIEEWKLPSRPTKTTDSRAKRFGYSQSVELDAIHPDSLREIVEEAITLHISERELAVVRAAEDSEREILDMFREYAREKCAHQ